MIDHRCFPAIEAEALHVRHFGRARQLIRHRALRLERVRTAARLDRSRYPDPERKHDPFTPTCSEHPNSQAQAPQAQAPYAQAPYAEPTVREANAIGVVPMRS